MKDAQCNHRPMEALIAAECEKLENLTSANCRETDALIRNRAIRRNGIHKQEGSLVVKIIWII
jgi:hypothetical protein